MFGGWLHFEKAAFRSIVAILHGNGWTGALMEADVSSQSKAESFLAAASVTRMKRAHQITACSLYSPLTKAYADFCGDDCEDASVTFDSWCTSHRMQSPQFEFWYLVLVIKLSIFSLIRSFREGSFPLYCQPGTMLLDAILLCQQQCQLCTVAFHSPERRAVLSHRIHHWPHNSKMGTL